MNTADGAPGPALEVRAAADRGATVVAAWHLLTARHLLDHRLRLVLIGASAADQDRLVAYAQHLGLAGLVVATDRTGDVTSPTPEVRLDLVDQRVPALTATELSVLLADVLHPAREAAADTTPPTPPGP